jgi:putative redox protein
MNVKVTWSNGLTFTGTAQSGFSVPLGGDPSVGGNDDGFRPLELFAIGLAGCTAMDVISILQKKRQKVAQFEVRIHAERAEEHPRTFTSNTSSRGKTSRKPPSNEPSNYPKRSTVPRRRC